jgi:hypothetical protein
MVWMYLVSLFGFSFAILSMAEMSSMYVATTGAHHTMIFADNNQGSYFRRTISVSDRFHLPCTYFDDLRTCLSGSCDLV